MGNNDYEVNKNGFNISTTMDSYTEEKKWSIEELEKSDFQIEELVICLHIIDRFKKKYPNDDIPVDMEELVRDEICRIFGGSLYEE